MEDDYIALITQMPNVGRVLARKYLGFRWPGLCHPPQFSVICPGGVSK